MFDSKIGFIRKYSHKLYDLSDQMRTKALARAGEVQPSDSTKAIKTVKDGEKKRKSSDKRGSAQ